MLTKKGQEELLELMQAIDAENQLAMDSPAKPQVREGVRSGNLQEYEIQEDYL